MRKRESIGRQVRIENGKPSTDKIIDKMATEVRFKDVLIYDNLSDDALLNNYLLGCAFAHDPRFMSTVCILNPRREELAKDYMTTLKLKNKEYGKDIDALLKARMDNGADEPISSTIDHVLTNIKLEVDSDLMFIAFMLGHYLTSLQMEAEDGK